MRFSNIESFYIVGTMLKSLLLCLVTITLTIAPPPPPPSSYPIATWITTTSQTVNSPETDNFPGSRNLMTLVSTNSSTTWLMGGQGATGILFNDVWEYSPLTNEWTILDVGCGQNVSGINLNSTINCPGSRSSHSAFYDATANTMWIFGGYGYNSEGILTFLNDLWKFNGFNWTQVITGCNSTVFGNYQPQFGVLCPGARKSHSMTIFPGTKIAYLFAGAGFGDGINGNTPLFAGALQDIWALSLLNDTWIYLSGSTVAGYNNSGNAGVYGTLNVSSPENQPGARFHSGLTMTDANTLWMFGGTGYGSSNSMRMPLGDLWLYYIIQNVWIWMDGYSSAVGVEYGVYPGEPGISGEVPYLYRPGSRYGHLLITDEVGNLWAGFGRGLGQQIAFLNVTGELSDIWQYNPSTYRWIWWYGSKTVNGTTPMYTTPMWPGDRLFFGYAVYIPQNTLYMYGGSRVVAANDQSALLGDGFSIDLSFNYCAVSECLHGATCVNMLTGFTCVCTPAFSGNLCQTELNACASQPCENGGTCTDLTAFAYSCACTSEFMGTNCTLVNPCFNNPCQNTGICISAVVNDTSASFNCTCISSYYSGDLCETCSSVLATQILQPSPSISYTQQMFGQFTVLTSVNLLVSSQESYSMTTFPAGAVYVFQQVEFQSDNFTLVQVLTSPSVTGLFVLEMSASLDGQYMCLTVTNDTSNSNTFLAIYQRINNEYVFITNIMSPRGSLNYGEPFTLITNFWLIVADGELLTDVYSVPTFNFIETIVPPLPDGQFLFGSIDGTASTFMVLCANINTYIYVSNSTGWTLFQAIADAYTSTSNTANTIVFGNSGNSYGSVSNAGTGEVWQLFNNTMFNYLQLLFEPHPSFNALCGSSIIVQNDTIVLGCPGYLTGICNVYEGIAEQYTYDALTNSWNWTRELNTYCQDNSGCNVNSNQPNYGLTVTSFNDNIVISAPGNDMQVYKYLYTSILLYLYTV